MEPEGLFPCSQEAVTVPCSEPAESVAHSSVAYVRKVHFNMHTPLWPMSVRYILILSPHPYLYLRSDRFYSRFATSDLFAFLMSLTQGRIKGFVGPRHSAYSA
jgi:hypothetical protein